MSCLPGRGSSRGWPSESGVPPAIPQPPLLQPSPAQEGLPTLFALHCGIVADLFEAEVAEVEHPGHNLDDQLLLLGRDADDFHGVLQRLRVGERGLEAPLKNSIGLDQLAAANIWYHF